MKTKSRLGQNFLTDTHAAARIVSALGELSGRTILEIGPGRGAITRLLAGRAGHLLAIELDNLLAARLREHVSPDRVTIIEQDILTLDFASAFAAVAPSPGASSRLSVIGNLPYYITSPILLKLAANHTAIDFAVLMVQREVADRVAAAPGSRDYGLLSVTVQMYGPVELLFTLPPSAFSPPPEVHSTVFRWRLAPRFAQLGVDEVPFLRFARAAFAQKRKTIANNLRAAGLSAVTANAALTAAAVPAGARAESLPIETLAAIWRFLQADDTTVGVASAAPNTRTEEI
jgi:16S rRNA (adenine1518-N6/adenine1519-N6)-dimethyltransferase